MRIVACSELRLVVLTVALAACSSDPGVAGPPHGDSGSAPTDAATIPDVGLPPGEPTYHGVVDDLLAAHCWGCHSAAGGGIAPHSFDRFQDAHDLAPLIAVRTAARTMPPFFAVNDGTCQQFQDHGRWLSDAEIEILDLWNQRGAPEGDPTTPPPTVMAAPHIDTPDATLMMPMAYTPQAMSASSPNEIRCFVADPGVTSDAFITAYEVLPGSPTIVHHVIVYEPESDADATTAVGMQGADGRPGYACNGGPIVPAHPVALWAPGAHRTDYPAGTGLALPAGRSLVIQVHYNLASVGTGPTPSDQTSIRFATTPSVTQPAGMILLSQNHISLAPRMSSVMSTPKTMTVPADATVWGLFPHMHVTGRHLGLTLQHAGSSSCAIDVERWDFNWQQAYFYETPLHVSAGDVVTLQCEYDTSSRDATTTFGEGTENEMCLSFFYVTVP